MTALPAPGIYFGLPEAVYHAVPALSNSGIKWLMVSPMDFWARSHLNPDYEPEEKDCFTLGTAYDVRITEGKGAFYGRYAAALDPEDHPDALTTADDLRAALRDAGAKVGGNKPDLIARLIEVNPALAANIWDVMLDDHLKHHEGKILLDQDTISKVEIAAAMVEHHPQLSKAFTGGYPQVSIFWTCPETGCPMKSRFDYLKTRAIVDLKTMANPHGKPIDRAVTYEMASRRYHIQAAVYQEAVEALKAMIRQDRESAVHGEPEPSWVDGLAAANEHAFLFVFLQTGVAPVARGYQFPKGLVFDCGKIVVREMKARYVEYLDRFGESPWVDTTEIRSFADEEFPVFMTE